ncbi:MAG: acyl-CoA dehydrogenase family protein [Ardenticatenales bacterium]
MYRLDPDQTRILDTVRMIADGVIAANADDVDQRGRFPAESIRALGDAGLLGLTVPTEYGGMGQGTRVMAAALDAVAQRCASTAMVYLMHLAGVAYYSARPDVAADALRESAAGRHLSTLAWSEKGSRSHFWAPMSEATAANGHVSLTADKSWVTSAGIADGYIVSSRAPGASGPLDSALYYVTKDDPGLTVSGGWSALGMRGNASSPMRLDGTTIPAARQLSEPGKGMDAMLGIGLPIFAVGNSAVALGIAEAAVASTQAHLTGQGFEHLGSKLADLPTLRARLAQMRIETDRGRAHLGSVIDHLENPGPATMLYVLESKAAANETALTVTDLAMKACGGAAFSRHLSVERNFRDARAGSVMAPTTDVLYDFIGKALCGMELFA